MISCHIDGLASIVRCHMERGAVTSIVGEQPVWMIGLVAEYQLPAMMRDDLGFVTFTQMSYTGYSEN